MVLGIRLKKNIRQLTCLGHQKNKTMNSPIHEFKVGLTAYIRNVTCRTTYMRKQSKNRGEQKPLKSKFNISSKGKESRIKF